MWGFTRRSQRAFTARGMGDRATMGSVQGVPQLGAGVHGRAVVRGSLEGVFEGLVVGLGRLCRMPGAGRLSRPGRTEVGDLGEIGSLHALVLEPAGGQLGIVNCNARPAGEQVQRVKQDRDAGNVLKRGLRV